MYIQYWRCGYFNKPLNNVELIFYGKRIYLASTFIQKVIHWYHIYINHAVDGILTNTIQKVCYWKSLVTKADLHALPCKICQQFKKRKNIYEHLPPKTIAELKQWYLVHVDLIGPYSKSIRQHHPGGTVILNNSSITCMKMNDPDIGWFDIY